MRRTALLAVPAHPDLPISPKLRIVTFPTVERFGLIWTTLNGDEKELPRFEAWDDPDFQPIMAPTIDINGSAGGRSKASSTSRISHGRMSILWRWPDPIVPELTKSSAPRAAFASTI